MPIFVDYAGMNTLINQELDLSTNTLNTGSVRTVPDEIIDLSIGNRASATLVDLALRSDNTSGDYQGYIDETFPNGFALSCWVNLNSTNNGLHRTIFQAFNSTILASRNEDVIQFYFKNDEIKFELTDTNDMPCVWTWRLDTFSTPLTLTGDFNDKWVHLYLSWPYTTGHWDASGNQPTLTINGTNTYGAPGPFANGASAAPGYGGLPDENSTAAAIDHISIFDAAQVSTFFELDGQLQNLTIYNSSGNRASALYNGNIASTDLSKIPDHSDVVAHFYLGNETDVADSGIGNTVGMIEIFPALGTVIGAAGAGKIAQSTSTMRYHLGQRGVYSVPSNSLRPGYVGSVSDVDKLAAINTHRNGPYGYSTWRQLRTSQNPLSRHYRSSNMMTFVTSPGLVRNVSTDGDLRVRDRYSIIYRYTEPAVTQKAYPLVWNVGRHFKDEDGNVDMKNPQRFSIISSYGNQQIAFANDRVSRLHKFDPDEEKTEYTAIKDMYLENGLNKQDSPLTHWEFIQYRETVFPKPLQQYVSQSRTRPNFVSFYRHNRIDRNVIVLASDSADFGFPPSGGFLPEWEKSTWPLDVEKDFLTKDIPNAYAAYLGNARRGLLTNLSNTYYGLTNPGFTNITSSVQSDVELSVGIFDMIFAPLPIYSRRVSLALTASVQNPSGMFIDNSNIVSNGIIQYRGNSLWEAGSKRQVRNSDGTYSSASKEPFYDTYESYVEDVRKYGKNYSIIPEFRMSDQIEDYKRTSGQIELDMFSVTGGISNNSNSSEGNFYEIYSNTDFMRNFEIIADDHKDFTNGKVLSLRCKAIKKFLPYEGFYPCQRTVDLAERFYDSFKNNISLYNENNIELDGFNYGRQIILSPLFSPGVLFNSIKSGIAVDFPIHTDAATSGITSSYSPIQDEFVMSIDDFDKRIPFEALINPAKYLSNYNLTSNEPDPNGNLRAQAIWDGQGDGLYAEMANNFLAESINFFLPNGQLSSVVSKKQKDIRLQSGSVYGMRVKMRRSMNGTRGSVFLESDPSTPYTPPQDVASGSLRETFTMYSRPSAFGPPTNGTNTWTAGTSDYSGQSGTEHFFGINNAHLIDYTTTTTSVSLFQDSRRGFNFPFTPPYYHGEGWCQITFTASSDSMTIKQIQAASVYEYTRYDNTFIRVQSADSNKHSVTSSFFTGTGPQSFERINKNAVQLSASLNINGVGTVKKRGTAGAAGSLVVDSGLEEENRWIIQTKFETPMLNFNHISGSDHITLPLKGSGSVPRGMWHQYGRIPEEQEGVFLQVGPIPENYQTQVMGKPPNDLLEDMSEVLGFSGEGTKLGRLAERKEISEAVVAVPFIEESGRKKFFTLDKAKIDTYKLGLTAENEDDYRKLTNGSPSEQIGRSVLDQLQKMQKFIFPPSFDFLNFDTGKVTPIAMYIFEFSHTLSQTDLQDIWQNLPPTIGEEMEVSEVAITHPLLKKELLGPGGEGGTNTIEMPDKLKWMVFKVKQRASSNYFKKTVLRNPEINTEVDSGNVTQDEFGQTSTIQYNWPYDFFSLVEMVRIDAEVEMGNADFSSYTDNLPNWDPVQAEPEKIEYVVGGLEDDPIPDADVEEELSEEESDEIYVQMDDVEAGVYYFGGGSTEGVIDSNPGIPAKDKEIYGALKFKFAAEAYVEPLDSASVIFQRATFILAHTPYYSEMYHQMDAETYQEAEAWSINWYNTDSSFQRERDQASEEKEIIDALNASAVGSAAQSDRSKMKEYFMTRYRQIFDTNAKGEHVPKRQRTARSEAEKQTKDYLKNNTDYKQSQFNVKFKKNKQNVIDRLQSNDFTFYYPHASAGESGKF